jgi:LmbE family N-acetylglucosaminyl deacetylase
MATTAGTDPRGCGGRHHGPSRTHLDPHPPCDVWGAVCAPGLDGPHAERLRGARGLPVGACRRLVVLAAHLDEEVAVAGGLLARLAERGVRIDVLAVTEGDGAAGDAEGSSPVDLGRRLAHRALAHRRLGAHSAVRHELRMPAGRVADCELRVVAALRGLIGPEPDPDGLWVLAPWQHDGHPDHDAAGRAALTLCHAYGVRLFQYLLAAWQDPARTDVPWHRARTLALPPVLCARKHDALPAVLHRPGLLATRELFVTSGDVRDHHRA